MAINIRTDKNYRSESSCTFCQGNHTITGCESLIEQAIKGKALPFSERTYEQHYAMQYIEIKASRKTKRKTSARKCGYCGTTGHNRRDCTPMNEDEKLLIKANKVWRQIYAIKSIELGFAPASLVKYNESKGYNYSNGTQDYEEKMYLVGSELPTNLSVFALAEDYSLRQDIKIPAVGRDRPFDLKDFICSDSCNNGLSGGRYHYGGRGRKMVVITSSTYQYPQEWIDGDCDDILFVIKKWNKARVTKDILDPIRKHLIPLATRMGLWE